MVQIRKGDILNIRETDEVEKSKTKINSYEVDDIPAHKRFIVCILLKDDVKTKIRKTFTALELREGLVWGGRKA